MDKCTASVVILRRCTCLIGDKNMHFFTEWCPYKCMLVLVTAEKPFCLGSINKRQLNGKQQGELSGAGGILEGLVDLL